MRFFFKKKFFFSFCLHLGSFGTTPYSPSWNARCAHSSTTPSYGALRFFFSCLSNTNEIYGDAGHLMEERKKSPVQIDTSFPLLALISCSHRNEWIMLSVVGRIFGYSLSLASYIIYLCLLFIYMLDAYTATKKVSSHRGVIQHLGLKDSAGFFYIFFSRLSVCVVVLLLRRLFVIDLCPPIWAKTLDSQLNPDKRIKENWLMKNEEKTRNSFLVYYVKNCTELDNRELRRW